MLKIPLLGNATRFQAVHFQGGKKYACHIQKPPSANGVQKGVLFFFTGFLNQATTGG